jgi:hemerythrin
MIQWDEKYSLGIPSIDAQHKELIHIIDSLSDLLASGISGEDIYDPMIEIITSLTDYTIYHFKYEENLFEQYNYEHKIEHIREHKNLIAEIDNLDFDSIDDDQVAYGKKVLKFLITWVFKHISGTDYLYKDFMLSKGIK